MLSFGEFSVVYLTGAFDDAPSRTSTIFLTAKLSAIYANCAIFLTSKGTKYATTVGEFVPRPLTGAPPLDPTRGLPSPRLSDLGPLS